MDHKETIQPFRDARYQIKKRMEEFSKQKKKAELDKQLYVQQKVSEEQTKVRLQQRKEIEEATLRQEWYMRKLDYEKQIGESQAEHVGGGNAVVGRICAGIAHFLLKARNLVER